jgi:hypothetical protein
MIARNHEHVHRRLRIDIANHDATVILVYEVARNLSLDDLAKQAILF